MTRWGLTLPFGGVALRDHVREIFVFGSTQAMGERLGRFAAGGVTTFVLTPIGAPEGLEELIGALASARPC